MKKIPVSNYIKLGIIVVLTLTAVLLLRNIFIQNKLFEETTPVIRDYIVSEINSTEIYNYIRENENSIIYVCAASEKNCREFEKEFGPLIEEKELKNDITYLNIGSEKKKTAFIKEFSKFYNTKLLGYPSLVLFKDGKVQDILTVKTDKKLELDKVKEFLTRNNITSGYYD